MTDFAGSVLGGFLGAAGALVFTKMYESVKKIIKDAHQVSAEQKKPFSQPTSSAEIYA